MVFVFAQYISVYLLLYPDLGLALSEYKQLYSYGQISANISRGNIMQQVYLSIARHGNILRKCLLNEGPCIHMTNHAITRSILGGSLARRTHVSPLYTSSGTKGLIKRFILICILYCS